MYKLQKKTTVTDFTDLDYPQPAEVWTDIDFGPSIIQLLNKVPCTQKDNYRVSRCNPGDAAAIQRKKHSATLNREQTLYHQICLSQSEL